MKVGILGGGITGITLQRYLRHPNEVEEYLARREQQAEEVQQRIENQQGDLSGIRARLLTQRQA